MFSERVQSRAVQRETTHRRVLAAAERLFREQGFAATTVRQIAAEAGVSSGTVMAVGDKDALLVAIFDGWIGAAHRSRAGSAPAPTVDAIVALFEPFIRYFARDEELSREYAAIIVRGSHESAIFEDLAQALLGEITAVLDSAGSDDAERAARVVYFACLGILMTVSHGTIREPEAADRLREVVAFVIGAAA